MNNSESTTPGSELMTQADDLEAASAEEPTEALSLQVTQFLRLCWLRRWVIFGILFMGIAISTLIALLEPNTYTSTTTFLPPDTSSPYSNLMNMMTSNSSAASLGSELLGISAPGNYLLVFFKAEMSWTALSRVSTLPITTMQREK